MVKAVKEHTDRDYYCIIIEANLITEIKLLYPPNQCVFYRYNDEEGNDITPQPLYIPQEDLKIKKKKKVQGRLPRH